MSRAIVSGSDSFDQAFVGIDVVSRSASSRRSIVVVDMNDLAQRVGRFLETEGYVICDCIGRVGPLPPGHDAIGLLSDWTVIPRLFRYGRRRWYGVMWLRNSARGASPDHHWVLDVHGALHVPKLSLTAEKVAPAFGVDVTVRVVSGAIELDERAMTC